MKMSGYYYAVLKILLNSRKVITDIFASLSKSVK